MYNQNMPALPWLTTEQMRRVDELMIAHYGIALIQMMENAGHNLAEWTLRLIGPRPRVIVLAGSGNNGGGGMAAARHLHNRGADVCVLHVGNRPLKEVPARQWRILEALGLTATPARMDLTAADCILDAMIGYGLRGSPRPEIAAWIRRANASGTPVLSLDAPSGLDTTSGQPADPCIRATATLTLALPKVGLRTATARPFVGQLWLADISVPPELYRQMGLHVPPVFEKDTIVCLESEL